MPGPLILVLPIHKRALENHSPEPFCKKAGHKLWSRSLEKARFHAPVGAHRSRLSARFKKRNSLLFYGSMGSCQQVPYFTLSRRTGDLPFTFFPRMLLKNAGFPKHNWPPSQCLHTEMAAFLCAERFDAHKKSMSSFSVGPSCREYTTDVYKASWTFLAGCCFFPIVSRKSENRFRS